MPNTVPAAAAGLPGETTILAETGSGLAVVRPVALKALRPTFLTEEETDTLLSLLDEIQSVGQRESATYDRMNDLPHDAYIGRLIELHEAPFYRFSHMRPNVTDEEYDDLGDKDHAAFVALASYRCQTIEEARVWARRVAIYVGWAQWPDFAIDALRALARLPAEEKEA